jgi:transposase
MIDLLEIQIATIERDLRALARHQTGCQALMRQYGMGEISALVTLCELGDVSRLHASRQAVRMAGIDIAVHRPPAAGSPETPRTAGLLMSSLATKRIAGRGCC